MFKTRFISMLVLLAAVVTGAMAQTEELLTTITLGGEPWSLQPVYTESGRATLETSGTVDKNMVRPEIYGWSNSSPLAIGSVTINPAEGYTITKVVFWDYNDGYYNALTDNASPFTCYMKGSQRSLNEDMSSPNGKAIAKIEVYGYAPTVAVTGVTLAPTSATLTLGETETVTLIPTVLPAEATDKSVTWSSSDEAVATVTDGVVTAVAAGTATITVTTTDGAKTATCAVTVAAPAASTYTVALKEGTEDATSWTIAPAEATTTGVEAGTEVTATYGGMKKVKSVKAVKKAASLIVNPVVGQVIGSDGKNYNANATLPDGVTAVAMIAYLGNGSDCTNGLAIQLNASPEKKNWNDAKTYASGFTAVPGGTWRLPSKADWQNMFVGCAKSGDAGASDDMDPIAGFKEKIVATGITWRSGDYWSSTDSGSDAWVVDVNLGNSNAFGYFYEDGTSTQCYVLGCLAF